MFTTVAICTHNPKPQYFSQVLQALSTQTLSPDSWELLIIDNASSPPLDITKAANWHPNCKLILEEQLGLTHARIRSIREARGELLVFVDDDNILDRDYLENAVAIAKDRTYIGAWSGQSHPIFDAPPPEWSRRYWGMLVAREFSVARWSNLWLLADTMPCGAGMCIRRSVALEYCRLHDEGKRPKLLDRQGSSLLSGGDNDMAACACDIGLGVGLFPELQLRHLIPQWRLTPTYLERLAEAMSYSSVYLQSARGVRPLRASNARRLLRYVQGLRMSSIDRRIHSSRHRGECQAIRELKKSCPFD